jgi:hypothetical protein
MEGRSNAVELCVERRDDHAGVRMHAHGERIQRRPGRPIALATMRGAMDDVPVQERQDLVETGLVPCDVEHTAVVLPWLILWIGLLACVEIASFCIRHYNRHVLICAQASKVSGHVCIARAEVL